MAIRARGKHWQVYYRHPGTGKIVSETYDTEIEAQKQNSLVLHRLKYERESFECAAETQCRKGLPLSQAYVEYLSSHDFSRSCIVYHKRILDIVVKVIGDKDVAEITRQDCQRVVENIRALDLMQTTKALYTRSLRAVLNFAYREGYRESKIDFPSVSTGRCRTFVPPTPEEITKMFECASPHIQRVLIIGAYIGARVGPSELFRLTWEHVDFEHRLIRIPACGKNENIRGYREVPVRESLMPVLEEWKKEDNGEGHLIHYRGRPVQNVTHAWHNTLKRAGLRSFRPYDLRHAFGTELVAAGVDIGTVAKLMGHQSPVMLLNHYAYVTNKSKRSAVEALPEIGMSVMYVKEDEHDES